jgi:hypothetical protein
VDSLRIESYTNEIAGEIQNRLQREVRQSWLGDYVPQVFQICDELIKNALKSNYRFLLLWQATRHRLRDSHPEYSPDEIDQWLAEVFDSGEDRLIQQHLARIEDQAASIGGEVRRLLDLENRYIRDGVNNAEPTPQASGADSEAPPANPALEPLLAIKRLAGDLKIHAHFRLERTSDQLLVTVANDSPILQDDLQRIAMVRSRFRTYREAGRQQDFFIENLDTSGGGHGLGYPIMDSILCELNLDPERSLYLIAATRTMVLLVLPLREASATHHVAEQAAPDPLALPRDEN